MANWLLLVLNISAAFIHDDHSFYLNERSRVNFLIIMSPSLPQKEYLCLNSLPTALQL